MSVLKCKMCGASLEINDSTIAVCEYCGSQQTLPKTSEDVVTNLFNRANNLRLKSEFDKAMQIYEKILNQNNNEAEAHWGIVLCKYGIEYVEDPNTFKRVPTCHRTQYESVLADVDYLAAVANSDGDTKELYKSQAEEIAALQKDILAIVKNEKPFDVFICYKETDENGKRTIDSALANDIYYQLTQEGLKVFYAAITLEDKLGMEYEPYIFAALNSAKVMLVVGTKTEYFDAVWVRNEWSRYLKMMKEDRSKLLIPCYRDMDAYDLPEEFSHLQAQDMSKIGFVNDIVRGIKKVVGSDEPKPVVIRETVAAETAAAPAGVAPLLTRAFMFLEDGDFERADSFCEQVLNQEPDNAQAYVGKLMADLHVKKQEFLKNHPVPFEGNNNYNKALRFGDDDLKNELKGYISHIYTRNENARLEGIYARAKDIISSEKTEKTYKEAAQLFESISEYKDSAALAKDCYEKAEAARKDAIYADAVEKMDRGAWGCTSAISQFESISGWKDADEKINECKAKIDEIKKEEAKEVAKIKKFALIGIAALVALIAFFVILNNLIIPSGKYKKATELMDAGKYTEAISVFEAIDGYKDSATKITECNTVILDGKYNDAITLMDAGNIIEAYEALVALDGYKDSTDKANSIYDKYRFEKLKVAKAGDYVLFGSYEQDNNTSNGKEDVEWLVLEIKDGKVLVISKYALDCKKYNTRYADVTWETCTLREWLNNDFLGAAFSADEKSRIPTVTVSADKNPDYSTNPGNATQDQVFLLSITEVNKYFSSDIIAGQCEPTDYAVAGGAYVDSTIGNCEWWLRTPGIRRENAAVVNDFGAVSKFGDSVFYDDNAVRPALWIDLNS